MQKVLRETLEQEFKGVLDQVGQPVRKRKLAKKDHKEMWEQKEKRAKQDTEVRNDLKLIL